jgi:hypothetical protein
MIKEYIKKNPNAKIILGILWGVAVGLLFRAACYGRKCVIINAPKVEDVTSKVQKENGKCYRFVSSDAECTDKTIDE